MKKLMFLSMFLLVIWGSAKSQVIHVKGIKGVELSYGLSENGNVFEGAYVQFLSNKLYLKAAVQHASLKDKNIDYTRTGLDLSSNYVIYNFNEIIFLNAVGGLVLSMDQLKDTEAFGSQRTMQFGLLAGAELEVYINSKLNLLFNYDQKYMIKEAFGNFRYQLTTGLRFNF